jgi:propanol-preferring alcohol dehydrogenase
VARGGLVSLVGEAGGELSFSFEALPPEASLTTTSWGSADDLRDVVQLARRHSLHWTVDQMPLREAQAAHDRLAAGKVPGRLVLVP